MTPEEIEPRVAEALKLLHLEIDDSLFSPRTAFERDKVVLMITGKSLRLALAVCHLVAGGFYGEAFGLTRSVLEAFFIAYHISNNAKGEERAHSYIELRKAHRNNREQIREKHFTSFTGKPTWFTQEFIDDVKKKFPKSTHQWVSARRMALEESDDPSDINPNTGKPFTAEVAYEDTF